MSFISEYSYSQIISRLFVYDKEFAIPIENANIILKNGHILTTDGLGMLSVSLSIPDTITISHVSYKPIKFFVKMGVTDTVYLETQKYELKQVDISPNTHLKRIGNSAKKSKNYGRLSAYGHEIAQRFKFPHFPVKLLDIKFHVMEMTADSLLIKASFYQISDKNLPGKKSIQQQILFVVTHNPDVSVDLSAFNIISDDDIILSLQIAKVYGKIEQGLPPYLKMPCKIDAIGQTFTRSWQSGWNRKTGASLGISLLIEY